MNVRYWLSRVRWRLACLRCFLTSHDDPHGYGECYRCGLCTGPDRVR